MATLTFNGVSYEVDHAVKGADFIHGYNKDSVLTVAFDGVTDFSGFTYSGVYMEPNHCLAEGCNDVRYMDGGLKKADGTPLSPADYGAAPSGYGLGEHIANLGVLADANEATVTGSYNINHNTANGISGIATLIVNGFSSNYVSQTAIAVSTGQVFQRHKINGTWGAWEHVNPYMESGVEYRTPERYWGEPVYVFLYDLGYANASGSFAHGLAVKRSISINLINGNEDVTHSGGINSLGFNSTDVFWDADWPMGAAKFMLKYNK